VTADQIFNGLGLTLVLAVGSQVLASRLRIPALIVLLPVGFVAGALSDDINPNNLLGSLFQPLVSLAVAVILFDSGVGLNLRRLQGSARRVVVRLIVIGVPVTLALAALVAAPLLGMSKGAAIMLGAILVVSGPTVVGPLLNFVRPTERVQRVLAWEGSLIDPVGGILGALVFDAVWFPYLAGSVSSRCTSAALRQNPQPDETHVAVIEGSRATTTRQGHPICRSWPTEV
jgi:NhaP-type Na+/H+ or K+/H+ antiporter